jgi:hypothetical protein
VKEKMEMEGKESYRFSMDEEMVALKNNDTWDLVPLPIKWKMVECKWVFKRKIILNCNFEKHNAILVAKRYSQV